MNEKVSCIFPAGGKRLTMEFTYICKISLALKSNRYPIVVQGGVYTECVHQQTGVSQAILELVSQSWRSFCETFVASHVIEEKQKPWCALTMLNLTKILGS